ncbi:MAG: PAS domain-containing sensor histidine kinase [bacterium]|nr:PAS domain-containing sensor histidine kinase [bacterium]
MTTSKGVSASDTLIEVHRILGWMDLVIGSINDAVCVVDKQGKIIFSNNYFANLLSTPRIFLLGQPFDDVFLIKPADVPVTEYLTPMNRLGETSQGENIIYEWTDKENNRLFFRVSQRLLPSNEQIVYLIQNITGEYELTLMKNSFIDLASHQLRTPMTAIMTYSHMLRNGYAGKLNEEQQELANTLVASSERMISLVDGLLNITRVQSTSRLIKKSKIMIGEIFEKISKELEPRITDKKLQYTTEINKNFKHIHTDESILHEIFSNLIVNAIQYTPAGGSINITAKFKNKILTISIIDTGIGIPKEHQPYLFEQFSRAENAMHEFTEGTGLGLYMVKLLLNKIDGTISFTSKLNVGTTFIVSIPVS